MGFHDGELAVQRRAGVRGQAARLAGMLAPPDLSGGASRFLDERTFAGLSARDSRGRLWLSPLVGPRGFLEAEQTTLRVHARPAQTDPLHNLPPGQPAGLIALDFATRRRLRVNGYLSAAGVDGLTVDVEQAYGNCPRYIQQRHLELGSAVPVPVTWSSTLSAEQAAMIERSDTFLLGTAHPERGADASHRGGTAGFVRVAGGELWWPDYPGNNLFNSLGNLAVDGTAALLFIDFGSGDTLQLAGNAAVEWFVPGSSGDDGGTGRRVRLTVRDVVAGNLPALRAPDLAPYPGNPPLTGLVP